VTAAGRAALKRLDALIDEAQREFLSPLSASDRRQLVRLLEQLVDAAR
jgi:DNA-binding MarR family transcriptional regulator